MEPRYRAPPLPVPEQWPIPATIAGTEATATAPSTEAAQSPNEASTSASVAAWDIGWRDFFADARLQQLIAQALANNRDLRVAVLNIQLARAQYRVQRSNLLPAINASGSYTKEKLPPAVSGVGFPITESFYEVGVGVSSFELDLFGRVRSLTHAALEQYLAQEQARRSAQLSLIAQIANAYLTLASDRELQRLAQETLKSQEDSFGLTQKRHAIGAVSGLDLAQAQTTVESARADAARYEGNIAQDIDALTLLVGAPVDAALLPQDFDTKTIGLKALPAGLPSTVLLRRPDVLQAEHLLRSASAGYRRRPGGILSDHQPHRQHWLGEPGAVRSVQVRHRHLELYAAGHAAVVSWWSTGRQSLGRPHQPRHRAGAIRESDSVRLSRSGGRTRADADAGARAPGPGSAGGCRRSAPMTCRSSAISPAATAT